MSNYESGTEKRINELAKSLKEFRPEELSQEDRDFISNMKVINASEIKEPWKYSKWPDQMRKVRRRLSRQKSYVKF